MHLEMHPYLIGGHIKNIKACIKSQLIGSNYKMISKFAFFTILFALVAGKYFIIGPGKITFTQIVRCPEYSNLPLGFRITPHMYNKTTQLSDIHASLPIDIDDNLSVILKCYKIDNNVPRIVFSIEEKGACNILNKFAGELWADVQTKMGIQSKKCPIKKGNYSVKNYYFNLDKLKIKMLFEGQFRTRLIINDALNKTMYCEDYTFKLEPRN